VRFVTSVGKMSLGQQIKAARKPSSCSRFIARLPPTRWSTLARLSKSESFNDSGVIFWRPQHSWGIIRYSRSGQGRTLLPLEGEDKQSRLLYQPGKE
jgi:hypothetical protein